MAIVRIEQRNAHLAGPVRLDYVNGREGTIAKALLTAISNTRRGSADDRTEEATAIQWTLWGKQAENAAEYLGKGSHVNIVGRLRNNNYRDANNVQVWGFAFTCDEIDYLDSRADADARRPRSDDGQDSARGADTPEQADPIEAMNPNASADSTPSVTRVTKPRREQARRAAA